MSSETGGTICSRVGTSKFDIGGDKTGDGRWYDTFVPMADKIYGRHLELLEKEGEA
jgi:hypothetical protein